MKKNIYSLAPLAKLLTASNRRYLSFISAFDDPHNGREDLKKISAPTVKNNRRYKGFNLFDQEDLSLLLVIARGEFNISGFTNKAIRAMLKQRSTGQVSRLIKRLREHGIIRKTARAYKYYLTDLGKRLIATALSVKEFIIIPKLNTALD